MQSVDRRNVISVEASGTLLGNVLQKAKGKEKESLQKAKERQRVRERTKDREREVLCVGLVRR